MRVVYLSGSYCVPCKALKPMAKSVAESMGYVFEEISVDQEAEKALPYNPLSVPTIVVEKGGKEVGRLCQSFTKRDLEKALA